MQHILEATHTYPEIDPGAPGPATINCEENGIDPVTLAGLDIALFKCLRKIGTSRQRICSALCLSYAEYDYISKFLQVP